jgi:hypothetical protein
VEAFGFQKSHSRSIGAMKLVMRRQLGQDRFDFSDRLQVFGQFRNGGLNVFQRFKPGRQERLQNRILCRISERKVLIANHADSRQQNSGTAEKNLQR